MLSMKQLKWDSPDSLPASQNNFYNKTVPSTSVWSQWCMTALITQETETFHPFTTDEWRVFFGFVCHQRSYLHIHSDSPPGLQPALRSVVPPTKSSASPLDARWGGQRRRGGGEVESRQLVHHCNERAEGVGRNEAEGRGKYGEGEGGEREREGWRDWSVDWKGFEGGNTLHNTLNQTVNKKWKCYSRLCSKAEQETK